MGRTSHLLAPNSLGGISTVALLALVLGCSPPVATDPTQPEGALVGKKDTVTPVAEKATESPAEVIQEVWEETYYQGVKVGFAKTEIAKVREGDAILIRCQQSGELHIKREDQSSDQVMSFTCWQTEDGKLVRFESLLDGGGTKILGDGKVEGDKLRTQTHTVGKTERQSFDWQPEWGGFVAVDESLRNRPPKPGEERTIVALTAPLNAPAVTKLAADDYEVTKLLNGEQMLLKVRATIHLGEQTVESTLWIDDHGEILKTRQSLGLENYRTTKSAATNLANIGEIDLLRSSVVKPIDSTNPKRQRGSDQLAVDLASAHRAIYLVRLKEGDPLKSFTECGNQQLERVDVRSARLVITAIRPDLPKDFDYRELSHEGDLAPTSYIQSDDTEVVRLANSVAAAEKDAWKLACALEKFVDETITDKNFSSALATAAEVARSKAGDCTEHSVLFAALCRARKIPARVAFGLIYVEHLGGFAYHMWTEAWIEDRWIPMDATLGRGGIGCDHIKLGDSNLKGSESLAAMASVAQVLNQLEIEIVEIE